MLVATIVQGKWVTSLDQFDQMEVYIAGHACYRRQFLQRPATVEKRQEEEEEAGSLDIDDNRISLSSKDPGFFQRDAPSSGFPWTWGKTGLTLGWYLGG